MAAVILIEHTAFVIGVASTIFGWIGAIITLYGGLLAAVRLGMRELLRRPLKFSDIRLDFTHKIVFGLEFFIAADILTTLIAPTIDELLLLGAVVIIRTVLGYFLEKEVEDLNCTIT
jgi:uncharacterized membrane protein